MPTQNQIEQAQFAAYQRRLAANQAKPPEPTAEERGIMADVSLPGPVGFVKGMLSPENSIPAMAQAGVTAATGNPALGTAASFAAQPVGTAAKNLITGESGGYAGDLALNAFGQFIGGPAVGAVSSKIGQSGVAQTLRGWFARKTVGRVTPDSREAYEFSRRMIDDATNAVNAARAKNGKPLYTRQDVESRIAPHLENLRQRGAFTIPQLTRGGKADVLEPVASGSFAGRGISASKQEDQDVLFQEWPKIFAASFGDELGGPDDLAALAVMAIKPRLDALAGEAGGRMQAVQSAVNDKVIDINPEMLDPLKRQIALFAKRMSPDGKRKVRIDPEGIDRYLDDAIGIVERGTGTKFNWKTLGFDSVGGEDLTAMFPNATPEVRAQLAAQSKAPERINFTFGDIQTLQGHLGEIASRASQGDKGQAASTLGTLRDILNTKLDETIAAVDKQNGMRAGAPGSMLEQWNVAKSDYANAKRAADGFDARGWIASMQDYSKSGQKVLNEIWPLDSDANRVSKLRDLMGGPNSAEWKKLQRMNVQRIFDNTPDPATLKDMLENDLKHSAEYWETSLGKDGFKTMRDYANAWTRKNAKSPFQSESGIIRRVDAGLLMATLPLTGGAYVLGHPVAAGATVAGTMGWLFTTKKVTQWLTNPEDSKMFMALMKGGPFKAKAREWFRAQTAKALAEASMTGEPEIRPVPVSASRSQLSERNRSLGRVQ